MAARLLLALRSAGVLTAQHIEEGFDRIMQDLGELILDVPDAPGGHGWAWGAKPREMWKNTEIYTDLANLKIIGLGYIQ